MARPCYFGHARRGPGNWASHVSGVAFKSHYGLKDQPAEVYLLYAFDAFRGNPKPEAINNLKRFENLGYLLSLTQAIPGKASFRNLSWPRTAALAAG